MRLSKVATASLLLAACFAARASAQTTWAGMQFGMTPDDVKRVFRQPMHVATGTEIVRDFPLTLVADGPVTIQRRINVTPKFSFDSSKRLQLIGLYSQRDDSYLNLEVARHLLEALAGKYGVPVEQTASCATEDPGRICRSTWRWEGQHITLGFRSKQDLSLEFLFLFYEANPTDI
jgi:hypothetical protein